MSTVLARLRVTEPHGIRRFLYPLTAEVILPASLDYAALDFATRDNDVDMDRLCLVTEEGQAVPVQVTHVVGERFRIGFAISLAPLATQDLLLTVGQPKIVDDPLRLSLWRENNKHGDESLLRSKQQRFEIALNNQALIREVIYDGVSFLRESLTITRNGRTPDEEQTIIFNTSSPSCVTLNAWAGISFRYDDHSSAHTDVGITACKSWATITHRHRKSKPGDEVVFTLPLAITSPTLIYDLGLEGVYGKIEAKNQDRVTWRMAAQGKAGARWSVATNDRMDYEGQLSGSEFRRKRWFHLVDSNKSLAVAITHVPRYWKEIEVGLGSDGEVRVAFHMRRRAEANATFGVCYHFLNDVPAIAAATNPQSILLPPTVEVLPT